MSSVKDWEDKGWTAALEDLVCMLELQPPADATIAEQRRLDCLEGVKELQHRWMMIGRHLDELGRGYVRMDGK